MVTCCICSCDLRNLWSVDVSFCSANVSSIFLIHSINVAIASLNFPDLSSAAFNLCSRSTSCSRHTHTSHIHTQTSTTDNASRQYTQLLQSVHLPACPMLLAQYGAFLGLWKFDRPVSMAIWTGKTATQPLLEPKAFTRWLHHCYAPLMIKLPSQQATSHQNEITSILLYLQSATLSGACHNCALSLVKMM